MLDDDAGEFGFGDDDMPFSRETFSPGDRGRYTKKAIERNIPTKTRRDIRGTVVTSDVGKRTAYTYTVTVLWDGYKRPHRYAATFITKCSD